MRRVIRLAAAILISVGTVSVLATQAVPEWLT